MPVFRNVGSEGTLVKKGVRRKVVHLENLMTAVIDFSDGPWMEPDPFHSHIQEQISYVVDGEIIFFCENEPDQYLRAGDMFYIPSGKKHAIQLLSPQARLIDNFSPIRKDFLDK
jgi:quercetin dioxygenase-like cupin family protein